MHSSSEQTRTATDRFAELRSIHDAVETALATAGRQIGLEPRWLPVLEVLTGSKDGVPQRLIEDTLGASQSTASRLVGALVRAGLAETATDDHDRRARVVRLTPSGHRAAGEASRLHRDIVDRTVPASSTSVLDSLIAPAPPEPAVIGFGESLFTVSAEPIALADALMVRDALEPALQLEAAQFRTADDIADLRRIVATMASLIDEPERFYRADWSLHRRVAQIARNRVLREVYLSLLAVAERSLDRVLDTEGLTDYLGRRLSIHEEIVDAVASGDPARVRRAATAHEFMGLRRREFADDERAHPDAWTAT